MSLLEMSIAGACLIAVIIVLRALMINRLPKRTFLVLWVIALMRLLVPVSVPSAFSIYTLIEEKAVIPELPGRQHSVETAEAEGDVWFRKPSGAGTGDTQRASDLLTEPGGQTAAVPPETVWRIVRLAGTVLLAVFFIVSYLRCRRRFQFSVPVQNGYIMTWSRKHPLLRSVSVRQTDQIRSPLTYGVIRPVILMPRQTDWNDEKQLEYILMHEYVHIRRFDVLLKLAMVAALCVHWFNPLVYAMYLLFNRDIELACDESVVRSFGVESRSAYSRMLIGMEEKQSGLVPFCNNFSKNAIEERIIAIMKTKKITVCSIVLACMLVAGTATVFATSAIREPDSGAVGTDTEKEEPDSGKVTADTESRSSEISTGTENNAGQETAGKVSYQTLSEGDYEKWGNMISAAGNTVMQVLVGNTERTYGKKYVFRSMDMGKSWQDGYDITESIPKDPTDVYFVNESFYQDSDDDSVYYLSPPDAR